MSQRDLRRCSTIYSNPSARISVFSGFKGEIPVAVKEQVHSNLDEANFAVAEAVLQAQLDHPNICRVYECYLEDVGSAEIKSVLVVELMEGDLMQQIKDREARQQCWSEPELLWTLLCLSEALSYSQRKGVAHKDIKPHNVLVKNREVKLADFGSSGLHLGLNAADDSLQGTPFFLSPELQQKYLAQYQGQDCHFFHDPFKSDVYSLGLTLLYMCTLKPPSVFGAPERALDSILNSLQEYPHLRSVLTPMLATRPELRYSFDDVVNVCLQYFYPMSMSVVMADGKAADNSSVTKAPVPWSKKCSVCFAAIADAQWHSTVPEPLKVYSAMLADFCSLQCLNSFHIITGANKCVGCKAALLQDLKGDVVLLECGHLFHSKFCFEKYVTDCTHRCICPECYKDISPETIDKELIAGKAEEIEKTKTLICCGVCSNGQGNLKNYCQFGHNVCTECDYSDIERWFFDPKCKVCRESKAKAIPHSQ